MKMIGTRGFLRTEIITATNVHFCQKKREQHATKIVLGELSLI